MRLAISGAALELGLVVSLLGGCAQTVFAHRAFAVTYSCPSAQVTKHSTRSASADYTPIAVMGCGYQAEYDCTFRSGYPISTADDVACTERGRVVFEATDGSRYGAWQDEPEAASKEALVASAAHDLSCTRASVVVVAASVAEGCGQRVRYQIVDYELPGAAGHIEQAVGRRYGMRERSPRPGMSQR